MKVFIVVATVFLSLNCYGQFWHRADSLSNNYLRALKKKHTKGQLIIAKGYFDHSKKESHTFLTKVDSLKIIIIAELDSCFEVAVFDDYNSPKKFTVDTCSIFRLVEDKKNEFSQLKDYIKSRGKTAKSNALIKRQHEKFETIIIRGKREKTSYMYRITDEKFDYNGDDMSTQAFYLATRQILDVAYLLANIN